MELTQATTLFDYSSYPTGSEEPVIICARNDDNYFGAQLSILYYFMFLFSFFCNGLVLVIIYQFEKLTTVTNILLLNLVLSSLLFMSSLPFLGAYMQLQNWIFGRVMCKVVGSMYNLGYYSSILFLALLTFDRHLIVVYSLGAAGMRKRMYAWAFCAVVWLLSGLACIRPMIIQNTIFIKRTNTTFCEEYPHNMTNHQAQQLEITGLYIDFFFFYIIPLLVIIYCYIRIVITVMSSSIVIRVKTVRLIFIIVLLFFLCWSPYNILELLMTVSPSYDCQDIKTRGYALHTTRNITYLYFCISPLFYTFVGKKFQNYFRQLLVKHFPTVNKQISVSQSSRSNTSTRITRIEL
ncbi:C-C chemokine receptor type 3-like [Betta splendens]|uniref:C-C chemokine receptor type 3-like n=1 Tax=Betta splendens TaxID=158456 RepID=A0A6P7M7Y0_BETSP|nr:C-C chemokine receptor type 3-like [Betta splendens]